MVYGLAHGGRIERAKRLAHFMLTKMMRTDARGPYFLSAVGPDGAIVTDKPVLVVNEQAYGMCGLVALFEMTKDPRVLEQLRACHAAFEARFHDPEHGGFFDGFDRAADKPVKIKSYNSTVYVATSYLAELASVDSERAAAYRARLTELADLIARHFPDAKTGFIVENFTADWKPDWRDWQRQGENTIGVVGHNFQAAWLLMRLAGLPGVAAPSAKTWTKAARAILESMLAKPVLDPATGAVGDVYKRETAEPMWHTNKAWWQQAEAMMALTLAQKSGLLRTRKVLEARDRAVDFYFQHFVDRERGGEYDEVDPAGKPTANASKGHLGKSTYHTVELARYMKLYARGR
jgi:mannobiose 2-epimerase